MSNALMINARDAFARQVMTRPSLYALVTDPDEWQSLQTMHARAGEILKAPRPAVEDVDIAKEVREALRAGKPLPKDFAAKQAKADAERAIREIEANTLRKVQNEIAMDLAALVEDSIADMVPALDAELAEVIDRGAELLVALDGRIDPLAAMRAKRVAEFEEFVELHETYLRIRVDAELVLVHQGGRALLDIDKGHHIMRGLARVWPTWRAVDTEPVSAGWVGPAGAPFPGDFESLEFFAWLVTHKDVAEPWVPSAEALTAQRAQDGRVDEETFQDRHGVPSVFTSTDRPKRAGQIIFGPRPDLTV